MIDFVRKTWCSTRWVYPLVGLVVNAVCWIGFTNAASTDEQCLSLSVSGAAQSVINGHYQLDTSFQLHCSGHPAWTKSSSTTPLGHTSVYIYYQEDGFDGWIISNTSCYTWGDFIAGISTDSLTPYGNDDGKRVWKESISGSRWTNNRRLTVQCHRFTSPSRSAGSYRPTVLLVASCAFVVVFVVTLLTAVFLARRCRKNEKQASLLVAIVSDPSIRYERVQSHHDM